MSPLAKMQRGMMANIVVTLLIVVLLREAVTLSSIIQSSSICESERINDLILSMITIVLFSEYPMMVSTAAIVVEETSNPIAMMKPSMQMTSCSRATMEQTA